MGQLTMVMKKPSTKRSTSKKYRSSLEVAVAQQLTESGVEFEYEGETIPYTSEYNPDFLLPNKVIIECKGYHRNFKEALAKLIKVKTQNPEKDIRIVWDNAKMKISKTMTAADWSEKHGFPWAHKEIPESWLKENKRT